MHRFRNGGVRLPDGLYWDVLGLYTDVLTGLRAAAAARSASRGWPIDSWAVDYGLVDARGALLGQPAALPRPAHRRRDRRRARQARPGPAVRHHRAAVPAVQHALPARRRARGSTAGAGAAGPGPARLLAHRPSGRRGDQRLHHRPAGRPHRRLVPPSSSRRSACRPGCCPTSSPAGDGARRRSPARSARRSASTTRCRSPPSGRTTPPRPSSACPPRRPGSATSPAAPGVWSASSSTRRCSPRTAGRRTSPTSAASTARSATCAT